MTQSAIRNPQSAIPGTQSTIRNPKSTIYNLNLAIIELLQRWGMAHPRALQPEAMNAQLACRDSLVVMPTGGGKSLCYQAPAVVCEGLTLVICPLISLMKDQVDKLKAIGVNAEFLNSQQHVHDQQAIEQRARTGKLSLLYVSPERVLQPACITLLQECLLRCIVVDEAHCISHWGHDFREAYGKLNLLRKIFPRVPIHAYTATATERVREEIVTQLGLVNPEVLVGEFDRPNLHLSVEPRVNLERQLIDFIRPRRDLAGIVYCMRRADTVQIAGALKCAGIDAAYYHGDVDTDERRSVQDAFMHGGVDVIVATVAFGMGIDRPDVRYVLHAAMPASIECYHQEIGRAGRDGDPAECVLFYGTDDYFNWLDMFEATDICLPVKRQLAAKMDYYCAPDPAVESPRCRHAWLTAYFNQPYTGPSPCGACDNCNQNRDSHGAEQA